MPQHKPAADSGPRVNSAPSRLNTEALASGGLALLIAYAIVRSVVGALSKPFWFDEICTWIIVRQPSLRAIWSTLERPADGQPPLYYLVERGAAKLAGNELLSFRLPSIFAFCAAIFLIFLFVRKRNGSACALLCAAIPFLTLVYDPYAIEARPYALIIALISLALVCYQHAPAAPWVILMGVSFALAQSLHYYAVFAVVPFAVAEAAFSLKSRKLRFGVWLAFACTIIPLALFFPLLWRQKLYYGDHFWAVPTWTKAAGFYGWSINYYTHRFLIPTLLAIAGLGAMVALAFRKIRSARLADPFFHEHVLVAALLGLPFAAYVVTKAAHGALDDRYTLAAVLAYPLAAGYILHRVNRGVVLLVALVIVSALAVQEVNFWKAQRGHVGEMASPAEPIERLVNAANRPDLPVLISDGHDYLPLLRYASPEWNRRFFAVVDLPQELVYTKADSIGKSLLALQCCYPFRVENFQDFSSANPQFLMYSNGSFWDWWFFRLVHDGDTVRLVAAREGLHVYLVDLNNRSRPPR
jgi:hypothetical protein